MSRPQVTITLGRSGQVVKRPGSVSDKSRSDYAPLSGNKRSIRDRLGSNADKPSSNKSQTKNKRQRREGNKRSSGDDGTDASHVNRNDLRYKLMRKNMPRRTWSAGEEQRNKMDLREKLARTTQPPMRVDARQHMPEPKASGLLRRIPPTRSADNLLQMDSLRKSYSAWTLDGPRHRSPDRILSTSRGLSPPRNVDVMRQVSSIRPVDASRPTPFSSKDILDASRPSSYLTKSTVSFNGAKPAVRLPPPSASGIMQKGSYMGDEPLTVANLLHSLGLGKYAIIFQAEEVDMTALKQMGDNDLKELGIPMGPRKKILLAILPRTKRQP